MNFTSPNINLQSNSARQEALAKGITKGNAEGKAEGKAEGNIETARKMLAKGYNVADICELTGLKENEPS